MYNSTMWVADSIETIDVGGPRGREDQWSTTCVDDRPYAKPRPALTAVTENPINWNPLLQRDTNDDGQSLRGPSAKVRTTW